MVQGLRRLNRRLKHTIPARVSAAAREALEEGAEELVAAMRRLVPVDQGDLRDSIGWTWGDAPSGALAVAQALGGSGERITVYAGGGDAFYVFFQEFGTRNMPPQPFFFVSYRGMRRRIKGRVTRKIRKAIRES